MSDRLLRRADIAAVLNTSQGVAATILAQNGVHPIDWGGLRAWPALAGIGSSGRIAGNERRCTTQAKREKKESKSSIPRASIADLRVNELHSILTQGQCVQ